MSVKSRTCGVYLITNTANGKRYIGSSLNIERRWNQHRRALRINKHSNAHLQAAWRKYGELVFKFELLCLTDQLCQVEQAFLAAWEPEYNIAKDTVAPMRGQKFTAEHRAKIGLAHKGFVHSEESKRKMSIGHKGWNPSTNTREKMSSAHKGSSLSEETRAKIGIGNKGKTLSVEARAKISAANKGKPSQNKGKPLSDETCAKISAARTGQPGHPHAEAFKIAMCGAGNPFAGKKHSEEACVKMRVAWARRKAAQRKVNDDGQGA
jgi:group I intron endonuclease